MELLGEKLRRERRRADLTQVELGQLVGVTARSISAYESGRSIPHKKVLQGLAKELNVTVEYLTNDTQDDPAAERVKEKCLDDIREEYGEKGVVEMEELLRMNVAFFAGGSANQTDKDNLYRVISSTYHMCKKEAAERFTPHKYRKPKPKE